ncbi:2-amino-4-oxopentanoate thiolase subunit OrtA [Mycoplasma sp. P36-A1]|uniref:2-amino-4-oxopentanoate thiolase subunit OrtA n=1 Tax=Mycoplasma sp. P36-A1 TaxID=3252900 RepID=UPI003C309FDF
MLVKKGSFVRIERVILQPEERTSKIPDETKSKPFTMWTKGFLLEDCELNKEAKILTKSNREDYGVLKEVDPMYELNYGEYLPEMTEIDRKLKAERYEK